MKTEIHQRTSDQPTRRPAMGWKQALRVTCMALALLACYFGMRSTAAHNAAMPEPVAAPLEAITGEWIIESKPSSDSLYLTVQRGGNEKGQDSEARYVRWHRTRREERLDPPAVRSIRGHAR